MATERLSMHKSREILRLKWLLDKSHRDIARSIKGSVGAVSNVLTRASEAGLNDWASVEALSDEALETKLYGERASVGGQRPLPDPLYIQRERRRPGVTLELLHLEYLEQHPDGYRYTQFCEFYRQWLKTRGLTMRQVHRAGEKLFVDYSGKKPSIVDPKTGVVTEVELFVAVLGASNYTYAEASLTQQVRDWIGSNNRVLSFLGGVPGAIVPDQLKSGVTVPCRYEPVVQRNFEELGAHYNTVVLPARPAKSRDKAKVEVAVQIAQRWILARLRNQTFFSLSELNERIGELLDDLNNRRMRLYGASRRDLFERLDKPALKPLPSKPFVFAEWKEATVNIDYHVEYDHHFYSAPHHLARERVEVRATATTVEILRHNERVYAHVRSFVRGGFTTIPEHMPKSHREHLEWSPSRIVHWGESVGIKTGELVAAILAERPHPEQGYRSCLGILRLGKRYGNDRLEAACARALAVRARSYRHVDSILKRGLDRLPLPTAEPPAQLTFAVRENVRGGGYYH
jgi:transposase